MVEIKKRYQDRTKTPGTSFEVVKDENGKVTNPEVLSLTRQDLADDQDINKIVERGIRTGFLGTGMESRRIPNCGDFSDGTDFLDKQKAVLDFKEDFQNLPAYIKNEFDNDESKFIDAALDPNQKERMYELGVAQRPKKKPEYVKADGTKMTDQEVDTYLKQRALDREAQEPK
jgi:hypothetical protein